MNYFEQWSSPVQEKEGKGHKVQADEGLGQALVVLTRSRTGLRLRLAYAGPVVPTSSFWPVVLRRPALSHVAKVEMLTIPSPFLTIPNRRSVSRQVRPVTPSRMP
jgi:hypothetical protein